MFEKEAEEYFEKECLHSYADTEEELKEDVMAAFKAGAEFGYNKAKGDCRMTETIRADNSETLKNVLLRIKALEEQIEKMKCCENCAWWYRLPNGQKDCAEKCENLDNWSLRK